MFKRLRAPLLAGLLYALTFPLAFRTDNLIPAWMPLVLVWFSWAPLLKDLGSSPKEAFGRGYAFGVVSNALALYWIVVAMKEYGGMSTLLSFSILALMVLTLALFPAIAAYSIARFVPEQRRIWLASVILALVEEVKTHVPFGGFPWLSPAYALNGALALIQALDLFGVFGFNLFIFWTNTVLADAWRNEFNRPRLRRIARGFFIGIAVLLSYGWIRTTQLDREIAAIKPVRAALIQGNIAQDQKWSSFSKREILETYASLSRSAVEKEAVDLVVWPEASLPFVTRNDTSKSPVETDYLPAKTELIFGAATSRSSRGKTIYINSAFQSSADGEILGRYDKQHLVPFGEYVPLERWISWLVPAVAGNFSASNQATVLASPHGAFSVLICYEALFPSLSRAFVNNGATFLLNITNDAWFNRTSGPFQHAVFSRFRSIETRRSVLRTANTGVSLWTDPVGRIFDATDLFETDIVFANAYPMHGRSLYVLFPWLLPLISLIYLGVALYKENRSR